MAAHAWIVGVSAERSRRPSTIMPAPTAPLVTTRHSCPCAASAAISAVRSPELRLVERIAPGTGEETRAEFDDDAVRGGVHILAQSGVANQEANQ